MAHSGRNFSRATPSWVSSSASNRPRRVELLAVGGVDYVMIDGEHNPIAAGDAVDMVRAAEAKGVPAMARVGENTQQVMAKYLDAGVLGVMIPMVNNGADARYVVDSVKYPPVGKRGLAGVRANDFATSPGYTDMANEATVVMVQIETRDGIDNADEIINTDGVDAVFPRPVRPFGRSRGPGRDEAPDGAGDDRAADGEDRCGGQDRGHHRPSARGLRLLARPWCPALPDGRQRAAARCHEGVRGRRARCRGGPVMAETVGVVGTGIMGGPMARNLAKAGFEVIAYNRTPARAEALRDDGVAVAASLAEVGATASVVITMVPDTPDVLAVVEGDGGLAGAMREGSVLIDMITISPAETRALAGRLAERGIAMLDAPVSGGSWGAQQATLTIMVGGKPETFERCMPVFEAMGKSITLMGPSGMGQTTKLVNQILVAGTCAAVAEALVFAASQGADLLKTVEAVSGGAAGSWQLSNLGPRMAQRDFAPGFMVKLQQKDLRLILEAAQERHVPLAVTGLARQYLTAVEAMGGADEGTQAVVKAVEALAGVEARQDVG